MVTTMRENGRARFSLANLPYIFTLITTTACAEYGIPIEIKLWDTGRTPLAHMVDVTNGFGLKVLAEHNFLNDNNIAFSPYGLMGILVALYEGVDGEASYQIQRGMQLPWNRNVMRVGFRDIHRTLKTYFVPEEGFLAGLALNNENVTFNESYKKILRFYGFDLENDQLPTFSPQGNNTNETTTMASTTMNPASADSSTVAMTSREDASTTPTKEETTPNPNVETISKVDVREPTPTTSAVPSSAPNAESTTTSSPATTTEPVTTTDQETIVPSTPTTVTVSTLPNTPSVSETESTTVMPSTSAAEETVSSQSTIALTDEPTATNEIETPTMASIGSTTDVTTNSPSTATAAITLSTETEGTTPSTMAERLETELGSTTPADMTTLPVSTTTVLNESSLETLERRKKSIVDFIFTNPPYVDDYLLYRSFDIGAELPKPTYDDTMFLVNGLKNVEVSYMHYDTVLEHAYLPHLEASALRLPLDSDRYYLLVVLPRRGGAAELGRLLARMARESDLSDVYAALRPRRVRAVVPGFTVKGHVTLTTDLQKLGIRDVFEPRQRDFTPMTRQAGVYVRSIEQAVSVAIRKYKPDDQKKNRYVKNREPVSFSATYPFLYFVMDANIHVSLMAGKMVDPLNSRIL